MLLVIISVPAIGLLFFQNKQVQTSLSTYFAEKISEEIGAKVSLSALKYSFFKRLYIYDLLIEDQSGDTLIYSEYTQIRIKRFKPEKLDIHIHSLSCENLYFNMKGDENRENNMRFITDRLKNNKPPEEKVVLKIDLLEAKNSHYSQTVATAASPPSGIDFGDMDIHQVQVRIEDLVSRMDTLHMNVVEAKGLEKTGFILGNASFGLTLGKQFMRFENGLIRTPGSLANIPVVDFRFNDYFDFREVFDSVYTKISSLESSLTFDDLSYFFYQVKDLKGEIQLDGAVHGRFGDLIGEDISINYLDSTQLEFDMELIDLNIPDSLFMIFNFEKFNSDLTSLDILTSYYNLEPLADSILATNIGSFEYSGLFSGYLTDFETSGKIDTRIGSLLFDMNLRPDSNRYIQYKGSLEANDFQIGKLLQREDIVENVSLNISVDGINEEGEIDISVNGQVDSVGIYGYNYRNIQLEGDFTNRGFDGSFSIKDPNIDMIFAGKVDFEEKIPQFKFTMDVANLRPYYLHLRDDDPEYLASFFLKTDMSGSNLNGMNGNIHLVNSFFKRSDFQVQIYDLMLNTINNEDTSYISLSSDLLDATIAGKFQTTDLPGAFKSIINSHLALFPGHDFQHDTLSRFSYNILFKETSQLMDFFFPRFEVANGSKISGSYMPQPDEYSFSLSGDLPSFEFDGYRFQNLLLTSSSDTNNLVVNLTSDLAVAPTGFEIENPVLSLGLFDNNTNFSLNWDNNGLPAYSGEISATGKLTHEFPGDFSYNLTVLPSSVIYNDKKFSIPSSNVFLTPESIAFDSLMINGFDQSVLADGKYSNSVEDEIHIILNNINLKSLNNLSDKVNFETRGRMSGEATVKKDENRPVFATDLLVDSLYFNNQLVGNMHAIATWNELNKSIQIDATAELDTVKRINISGVYHPGQRSLNFDVNLNKISAKTLQPYMGGVLNKLAGTVGMEVNLQGTLVEPIVNGRIYMADAGFNIIQTQTNYSITDQIRVYNNNLFFEDFIISDEYNNLMLVNGNITTSNFKSIIYNLDLNASNYNFLHTTSNDNEQFYGDIFATANISVRGQGQKIDIGVSAKTDRHTNLNLPLYNAAEIQSSDFITFKKAEEIEVKLKEEGIAAGRITLDMDLEIASGANVQLIFDPKVGDIIEASGVGNMKIKIDEGGNFSMFGDVLIQDGEYLFTLQNVINKRFRVKSGGNIVWSGSPTDAIIDLQAIYELKAAPYNLSPESDESLKKRIPVHCMLSLQGDLSNPNIQPSIELPTAEPETRSLLYNTIGTEEELMRQFISLLVINNFMSIDGIGTVPGSGGLAAGVTASELLSNQLSNWLSQISNDFDIGVNYRPGDQISSDEVEVALSTQLFDDRVILSGNLDVGGNEQNPGNPNSNIVGDFNLEFKVTDKISLKAFNRANDDFILRTAPYTQGVGIFYRNEFDELSDLLKKRNQKKSTKEVPAKEPNSAVLMREEDSNQ